MWKLLGRPKTQKVTKALAKQFMDMDSAPHDRPLSERRLAVYERLLNEGSFRPVTWATALCEETGGVYRVNGKHTSTLLASQKEIPEFFVTIEEYECDSLEDVAKLYSTFDSKMQSRTASDINQSFAATISALAGVAARTINIAVAGMTYHLGTYNNQPAERAESLLEYPEFVVWLHGLASENSPLESSNKGVTGSCKHILRQGVVGAAFGCWQKAKGPASEFWRAVRDETGARPDLPDRKLARYLAATGSTLGLGSRRSRRGDVREMYVKSIHAWNAWRKGEPTALRYIPEATPPAIK